MMKQVLIIGGGVGGLGAAWKFKEENGATSSLKYTILEKESRPGGLCRSERDGDFLFDYTGHLLHFRTDLFRELLFSIMKDNLDQRTRSAWIYSSGVHTRYPFQANLYGLPRDVIVECIYEYSKQYFKEKKGEIVTFSDWIRAYFGEGIARHFMIPYNKKVYRRDPAELTPECTGRFVPSSNLKLLLNGALSENSAELGYNSQFHYPVKGGIESMVTALASLVGNISVEESVEQIIPSRKVVITSKKRMLPYDYLISTQPLPLLVQSIQDDIPQIRASARKLRHVSVLNINLGVRGDLTDKHWVYVPQEEIVFHRMGFPHNFSDTLAPAGCSSIYLEISYNQGETIDPEKIMHEATGALIGMGTIKGREQIICEKIIDIPFGYVIFDKNRTEACKTIKNYLEDSGIYSVGRFGSWEYSSMEDAFLSGVSAASEIFEKFARFDDFSGKSTRSQIL